MYDVLGAEVSQSQGQFTDVQFDCALWEVDILLEVVAQVSSQKQVYHHKHVLLILEGIPAGEDGQEWGVIRPERFQDIWKRELGRCIQGRWKEERQQCNQNGGGRRNGRSGSHSGDGKNEVEAWSQDGKYVNVQVAGKEEEDNEELE